jgi:hypothetical protein
MRLRLVLEESRHGGCPAVYTTDRDGEATVIVQGWRVTDAQANDMAAAPDHETIVEVPLALILNAARELDERA